MEQLKIKDLKIISMLERFASLRSLSRHIGMEPQNLSKRLDVIETTLGYRLFERSPKGIALTSEGRYAIDKTKGILQNVFDLDHLQMDLSTS